MAFPRTIVRSTCSMTHEILSTLGLYGGTFLVCFLAGLIPLINAELFLAGVSAWAISSTAPLPAIVLLAAAGQMTAKLLLYYAALGVFELPSGKRREKIERARARIEKWKSKPKAVLALSATLGLPPFYLSSFAAGALKIRLRTFCAIGMAGRILRFSLVVAIPWLG